MPSRNRNQNTPPPHTSSNFALTPLSPYLAGNALVRGDNYDVMQRLPDECVDLIYLDPPFNSNQFYVAAFGDKGTVAQQLRDIWRWTAASERAFQDIEARAFRNPPHQRLLDALRGVRLQAGPDSNMAAYIVYMGKRLMEMRRVLKKTGSIYLHCDPHANAYLRILMDAVFGEKQFRNEIVWERIKGAGKTSQHKPKSYGASSDFIFFYAMSDISVFKIDDVKAPFSDDDLKKQFPLKDNKGRYKRRSPFRPPGLGPRPNLCYAYKDFTPPHPSGWTVSRQKLEEIDRAGDLEISNGKVYRKQRPTAGISPNNIWVDIPQPASKERLNYPTQKPLALLERIIKASSNPGDLVMDPFCGCGTAADAAAALGRKYLGIDISGIAVRVMQQRLESRGDAAAPQVHGLEWNDFGWKYFERHALMSRDDAEDGTPGWAWAEDKVAALLNAVPNEKKVGDGGVDARYYGAMDIDRNEGIIIPIQIKMHRESASVGRPDMQKLLGAQTAMQNRGLHAPMSIMVTLYDPTDPLRTFAAQQGRVTLNTSDAGAVEYPAMQALSVQEMLTRGERPKLPPVDPRSLVGDTQDRMLLA